MADIFEFAYRHQLPFFFFYFVVSVGVNKAGTEWMLTERKYALSIGLVTDSPGPSDHKRQKKKTDSTASILHHFS